MELSMIRTRPLTIDFLYLSNVMNHHKGFLEPLDGISANFMSS